MFSKNSTACTSDGIPIMVVTFLADPDVPSETMYYISTDVNSKGGRRFKVTRVLEGGTFDTVLDILKKDLGAIPGENWRIDGAGRITIIRTGDSAIGNLVSEDVNFMGLRLRVQGPYIKTPLNKLLGPRFTLL